MSEKLPPKLAGGNEKKNLRKLKKKAGLFKPTACLRCGCSKFNVHLLLQERRLTRMRLICTTCLRTTPIVVKRFE